GSDRGGSHTRCAGGPAPAMRETSTSSRVGGVSSGASGTGAVTGRVPYGRTATVAPARLAPQPLEVAPGPPAVALAPAPAPGGGAGARSGRPGGAATGTDAGAARNRIGFPAPEARYPCPGSAGSSKASGIPSTARDSSAEKVRRPIR